ncbi:MAG: YgjV family protein [Clostridiales bacterium]|nr:YgjV family protein [Clostridiales bacterium]
MKMMFWIAQAVGGLGILANALIYQQKDRDKLRLIKLISDVIWGVHYTLLGAYSGAAITVVAIFRELVFMNRERKKWASHAVWPVIFSVAAVVSSVISGHDKGLICLLPGFASAVSVIGFWIGRPKLSRVLYFPISGAMCAYDVFSGSVSGIINELISATSVIIGMIRLDAKKKKAQSEPENPQNVK